MKPPWALIGGRPAKPGASRALQQLVIRNSPCGRCCSGSASRANRSPCSARAGGMSASTSCEALRPATATDHRRRLAGAESRIRIAKALETMSVIEAANAGEEALAIAIALREAVESRARPRPWSHPIGPWRGACSPHSSAGRSRSTIRGGALSDTPAGTFARLAVEAALAGCAPVRRLALLKHPLARPGADGEHARTIMVLEKAVLRGPRPQPGTRAWSAPLPPCAVSSRSWHARSN